MNLDNTISKPSEDKLDYKYFAYYLAQAILNINSRQQSYAIGVCGKWGDGKTSAMNLALGYFKHLEQNPDFSIQKIDELIAQEDVIPYTGRQTLSQQTVLKLIKDFSVCTAIFILTYVLSYITAQKMFKFLAVYNLEFMFWVLLLLVIIAFVIYIIQQDITGAFKSLLSMIKHQLYENKNTPIIVFNAWNYHSPEKIQKEFFKNLTTQLGKNSFPCEGELIKLLNKYSKTLLNLPSMPEILEDNREFNLKNEINNLLTQKCKNHKIIVVIDNIDRLLPDEILTVFKLVRTLADFPNFVYLLGYDRIQVVKTLDDKFKINADDYIKKIVQTEKTLPIISNKKLMSFFLGKIKNVLGENKIREFESVQEDLKLLFEEVIVNQYVYNLRDIKKFINVFEFNYSIYKKENLNLYDLIGISLAETFDQELYNFIKTHKHNLCHGYGLKLNKDDYAYKNRYFLGFLFPQAVRPASVVSSMFTNQQPESEEQKELQNLSLTLNRLNSRNNRYRRIFNESFFDNYFKANLDKEYILQQEIDSLLTALDEPQDFADKFLAIYNANPAKITDFVNFWDTDYNKDYNTPDNILKLLKNFLLIKTDDREFYNNNCSTAETIKNMVRNKCSIYDILSVIEETRANCETFLYPYVLILCHVTKFPTQNPPKLDEQAGKLLDKICTYFNKKLNFSAIEKDPHPFICIEYLYKYLDCKSAALKMTNDLLKEKNENVLLKVLMDSKNSAILGENEYAHIVAFFREIGKSKKLKQRLITMYNHPDTLDKKYFINDIYESEPISIVHKVLYNVLDIDSILKNEVIIKFFNQEIRDDDVILAFLKALGTQLSQYNAQDLGIIQKLLQKEHVLTPKYRQLLSKNKKAYGNKYLVFKPVLDRFEYILKLTD